MRLLLSCLVLVSILQSCNETKPEYLRNNRFDLTSVDFKFPQQNFNIIGFGAYHGSSKTEDAEIALLKSLVKTKSISYYLPETDYSIAHYFNKYLKNGDTVLLKDLITVYGNRVPQERTIEVYEKWKQLKILNDQLPSQEKLRVVGIDIQVNYKYVSKHLLEILENWHYSAKPLKELEDMVKIDTTGYGLGDLSYAYGILKRFVDHYEANSQEFHEHISNVPEFKHIIKNLKLSFDPSANYADRDKVMYTNYIGLDSLYDFKKHPQFVRMGFSHLEKATEGKNGYSYFFTQLLEKGVYSKDKVLTIIGYLTKSKVVWNELYNVEGEYTGYTVEGGFGIGDYDKEYFRGIQNLKDSQISDKTLFRLNQSNSPYLTKEPDLIEIVMADEKSNGEAVQGMATLDFLDYALLISDSRESIPIFELFPAR